MEMAIFGVFLAVVVLVAVLSGRQRSARHSRGGRDGGAHWYSGSHSADNGWGGDSGGSSCGGGDGGGGGGGGN